MFPGIVRPPDAHGNAESSAQILHDIGPIYYNRGFMVLARCFCRIRDFLAWAFCFKCRCMPTFCFKYRGLCKCMPMFFLNDGI